MTLCFAKLAQYVAQVICVMSGNRLSPNNGAASEENYQAAETRRLDPSKCERVARAIR